MSPVISSAWLVYVTSGGPTVRVEAWAHAIPESALQCGLAKMAKAWAGVKHVGPEGPMDFMAPGQPLQEHAICLSQFFIECCLHSS